jgi:hypothetical protein
VQALHIQTATEAQRAAVGELMATTETPFGRPSITLASPSPDNPHGLILLSPAEPVDEPGDE